MKIRVIIRHLNSSTTPDVVFDVESSIACAVNYGSELIRDTIDEEESATEPDVVLDAGIVPALMFGLFYSFASQYPLDPLDAPVKPIPNMPFKDMVPKWCSELLDIEPREVNSLAHVANVLGCPELIRACLTKMACIVRDSDDLVSDFKLAPDEIMTEQDDEVFCRNNPHFKDLSN